MNKKHLVIILFACLFGVNLFAQKTLSEQEPLKILNNARLLYSQKHYSASYQECENWIRQSTKDNNPLHTEEIDFIKAMSASKLNMESSDKMLQDFVDTYSLSNKLNTVQFALLDVYMQKRTYRSVIKIGKGIDYGALTSKQQWEYNYKMGYAYFQEEDFAKAKELFLKVKQTTNQYVSSASYHYAHILYMEKDYDNALKEFESLTSDKNFKRLVPDYIVQILYHQKNYQELANRAEALSNSSNSKHSNETNRMIAEAFSKLDDSKTSIVYLEKSMQNNSNVTKEDSYLMGYNLLENERYAEAIPYFNKAIRGKDSLAQNALYHTAYCYLQTDDKERSRALFKEAYDLSIDTAITEDALFNYAKLSAELPNPFNQTLKSFQLYYKEYPNSKNINQVREYLATLYGQSRNYQDAIKLIEELPTRTQTIDKAYQRIALNRGIELFNENSYSLAIGLFDKSLQNKYDPTLTAAAYFLRAESSYKLSNYKVAEKNLQSFFSVKGAKESEYYNKANYSMGYSLFKQKQYSRATKYFKTYLKNTNTSDKRMRSDAYNRLADSYFMSRDFNNAIIAYDNVVKLRVMDVDYAIYQKALAYGAMGKIKQKAQTLEDAVAMFKKTTYMASMMFELANSYLVLEDNKNAVKYYSMVIEKYPKSIHTKTCMSKVGMIYYKEGKDDKAIATLEQLVKDYPSTEESKTGLMNIRSIYMEQDKVEEYYEYVQTVPNADFSINEQDSITYQAAESLYMEGKNDKAVVSLRKYINKFPSGYFAVNANYYLAQLLHKENQIDSALVSYMFVVNSPKNIFTQKSVLNAVNLQMKKQNYKAANQLYHMMEKQSETNTHKLAAQIGIMQTSFELMQYDTAIVYSRRVLEHDKLTEQRIDNAYFIIARSLYAKQDTAISLTYYQKLRESNNGDYSGEANYIFAKDAYDKQSYTEAENQVLAISENPSSEYWLAKSIILLGDVYRKMEKPTLAKQTYQSVAENYDGKELVDLAKAKMLDMDREAEEKKKAEERKRQEALKEVDEVVIEAVPVVSDTNAVVIDSIKTNIIIDTIPANNQEKQDTIKAN